MSPKLPRLQSVLSNKCRQYTTPSTKRSSSSIPRIAQPSLWSSLVPKFLRPLPATATDGSIRNTSSLRRFFQNPATPIALLGILCGSQAIQVLTLKSRMLQSSRKAEAKMALLHEVIKRVQAGEDVDVRKELGTGDPIKEKEWEDVLKEIEQDMTMERRRGKQARRRMDREVARREAESSTATAELETLPGEENSRTAKSRDGSTFY